MLIQLFNSVVVADEFEVCGIIGVACDKKVGGGAQKPESLGV